MDRRWEKVVLPDEDGAGDQHQLDLAVGGDGFRRIIEVSFMQRLRHLDHFVLMALFDQAVQLRDVLHADQFAQPFCFGENRGKFPGGLSMKTGWWDFSYPGQSAESHC